MSKGIFAGMTDYSHQSFSDILNDLENEVKNITAYVEPIEQSLDKLKASGYWNQKVPFDFKNIIAYSLKHYKTAQTELSEIIIEIQNEVREHHCKRLQRLSEVADDINIRIGKIWHQDYSRKDYENEDFQSVEFIYNETRDIAANLLDLSNIASRLNDFIGKTKIMTDKNQNLGGISNTTFGNNATIIVGNQNQVQNSYQIKERNFDDIKDVLKRNNVSDEDISELKEIVENETPDSTNNKLGNKANGWITKMVSKCLDGSWAIGIGAAGKLLADAIKAYYGLPI